MRAKELNTKAAELLTEKKLDDLRKLAEENGIPQGDVEDYIEGYEQELTTDKILAMGKVRREAEAMKLQGIFEDWVSYIKVCISENPEMAENVLAVDKTMEGCMAALVKWSLENAKPVRKEICKAAGVPAAVQDKVKLGIPSMAKAKELIRDYYGGRK